jgi:hypothetical protein
MPPNETNPHRCSEIVALERRAPKGILAVVYQEGRRHRALWLPDGTVAEVPSPDQRVEVPERPPEILGLATDGKMATVHHENLGLVATHVPLSGVFVLASGEVAAVYGAEVVPLG